MFLITRLTFSFLIMIFLGSGAGYGYHVYSSTFQLTPILSKNDQVHPEETLVIFFSESVIPDEYRKHIMFSPSIPVYAKWNENYTELSLTPKDYWKPETYYTLTLPEGLSEKLTALPKTDLTFSTLPHPKVTSITPEDSTKDVLIGIEDPFVVQFESSTEDFFIDFSLEPKIAVTYQNNPEKTEFKILPKENIQNGETYTLTISSRFKNAPENEYVNLASSTFTTLPPPPENWSDDLVQRTGQALKFTRPQIETGKYIDISLTSQTMVLFENGEAVNAFIVSSGQRGMDTPKGTHQIYNKHPRPWSKKYELFMPFWMAITSDGKYGLHELPEWPSGYKEGQNHLGIPVSHGCVRLGVGPAENIYNWAEIGTPVVVY